MTRILQIWQFGQPYAAEANLADAIALCKSTGMDAIAIKALDGVYWMGNGIDNTPDALNSVEKAAAHTQQCHENGLKFYVWTNPRASQNIDTQATLTAQLANATDGAFLDVEPYSGFWGAWQSIGLADLLMTKIRAIAPNAFIALQPDPRAGHLQEIRADEWMPHCDALCGQHYWTDFQTNPTAELDYAASLSNIYGKPVWPTLPGNTDPSIVPTGKISEFPGFVVWRMGSTPSGTLQVMSSSTPVDPTPPVDPVEPVDPTPPTDPGFDPSIIPGLITTIAVMGDNVADSLQSTLDSTRILIPANRKKMQAQIDFLRKLRSDSIGPRPVQSKLGNANTPMVAVQPEELSKEHLLILEGSDNPPSETR